MHDLMKLVSCPQCGYEMDAAEIVNSERTSRPRPGDLLICCRCAAMLTLSSQGKAIEFDETEVIARGPAFAEQVRIARKMILDSRHGYDRRN
jgi:hypothetical protein